MRFIRRGIFKVLVTSLATIIALCIYFRQEEKLTRKEIIELIEKSIVHPSNQYECHLPDLPLDNAEISQLYEKTPTIECGNGQEDWVKCENSLCFVKPELNLSDVTCWYNDIMRDTDFKSTQGAAVETSKPYALLRSDFVQAECWAAHGKHWLGLAYGMRNFNYVKTPEMPHFSVLILGFDAMSRNAFMRKMPQTHAYLREQLGAIDIHGYNVVGDGATHALLPILTGHMELELPDARKSLRRTANVDAFPLIWQQYAERGYVTSFNEDNAKDGVFAQRLRGFKQQPVDHYLRTLYLHKSINATNAHCLGKLPRHKVMLDYTLQFMRKYAYKPRFAFSFHALGGNSPQQPLKTAATLDADVLQWLRTLKQNEMLDDTILIFMSAHGDSFPSIRQTLQGKQEQRLPYLSFVLPKMFKNMFSQEFINLMANVKSLCTPFDLHATLQHILELQLQVKSAKPTVYKKPLLHVTKLAKTRAISLFQIIPNNRSCADAYIPAQWCACQSWLHVPWFERKHNQLLERLVAEVLRVINAATLNYRQLCAPLYSHKVNWAKRIEPSKEMLQFIASKDVDGYLPEMGAATPVRKEFYQLQLLLDPGALTFKARVKHDKLTGAVETSLANISRLKKYGAHAHCLKDINKALRSYCYCRDSSIQNQHSVVI